MRSSKLINDEGVCKKQRRLPSSHHIGRNEYHSVEQQIMRMNLAYVPSSAAQDRFEESIQRPISMSSANLPHGDDSRYMEISSNEPTPHAEGATETRMNLHTSRCSPREMPETTSNSLADGVIALLMLSSRTAETTIAFRSLASSGMPAATVGCTYKPTSKTLIGESIRST